MRRRQGGELSPGLDDFAIDPIAFTVSVDDVAVELLTGHARHRNIGWWGWVAEWDCELFAHTFIIPETRLFFQRRGKSMVELLSVPTYGLLAAVAGFNG